MTHWPDHDSPCNCASDTPYNDGHMILEAVGRQNRERLANEDRMFIWEHEDELATLETKHREEIGAIENAENEEIDRLQSTLDKRNECISSLENENEGLIEKLAEKEATLNAALKYAGELKAYYAR